MKYFLTHSLLKIVAKLRGVKDESGVKIDPKSLGADF
jgi:hypothetical protein